jgi:pimeloyl-ACP methyl ester carboxylesterase
MGEDEDLASLRADKAFGELVAAARAGEAKAEEKAYESGAELDGVKTVEGKPANGLRWRLRIGKDATVEKPHRLVVWLHPSGGSMNKKIEPLLAKDLAARGYALLVASAKNWMGWSERDATRLLDGTLPDVAKVEGLDARRPVLLGFSAGGQMALVLWAKEPARWGGLVLDAAYPIDMEAYMKSGPGPDSMLKLPEGDAKKGTPFFVLVGEADPGQMAWRGAEGPWHEAGVPLTVTYVPDGRHEWLFGADQLKALWTWLTDVAAGKLPGAPEASAKPTTK